MSDKLAEKPPTHKQAHATVIRCATREELRNALVFWPESVIGMNWKEFHLAHPSDRKDTFDALLKNLRRPLR